jgi:hypothetical protein
MDAFANATDMLHALHTRQITAVELLELHLRRIERYNPRLNAIVIPNYDQARQTAAQANVALAQGEARPLLGLPLTIKDCIYVKGLPVTGVANFLSLAVQPHGIPGNGFSGGSDPVGAAHRLAGGRPLSGRPHADPFRCTRGARVWRLSSSAWLR